MSRGAFGGNGNGPGGNGKGNGKGGTNGNGGNSQGGSPRCFLRGTKIRTLTGYQPVECLSVGDVLPTVFGGPAPHSLYIDGVLVPAWNLVNGTSITRDDAQYLDTIEYFHVILDQHDVIDAEGALCDTSDRPDSSDGTMKLVRADIGNPVHKHQQFKMLAQRLSLSSSAGQIDRVSITQ